MTPPAEVLAHYAADLAVGPWQFLGDAGGFSGARLWRLTTAWDTWRLKAWPAHSTTLDQLTRGHRLMHRAAECGLAWVPRVLTTRQAATCVEVQGQLWDLVSWRNGEVPAQFSERQLQAAGRALAQLHRAAERINAAIGPCPGILRRGEALAEVDFVRTTTRDDAPLAALAAHVRVLAPRALKELAAWRHVPLPLHACLCDVQRDHILFEQEEVSGIIDFGAAKVDHPATDLARYLGDALDGEPAGRQRLLNAYERIRPLSAQERELVGVLERSGIVVAALHWLQAKSDRSPRILERCRRLEQRLAALAVRSWR